jgi:four helix bundle protein
LDIGRWALDIGNLNTNVQYRMSNFQYPSKEMKYDLEERLINFSVQVITLVESMPSTKAANHLAGQLLRSGTSPALNYAEAQSGESRNDFIHKIKIVLKELRETGVCLRIIHKAKLFKSEEELKAILKETAELVAIFAKSAKTAEDNKK